MTLYNERISQQMKDQARAIKALKRHEEFYNIAENLGKSIGKPIYTSQHACSITVFIYLKEKDDKSLPELCNEIVLSSTKVEEIKDRKVESGEAFYFYRLKKPVFGSGERPTMTLRVDFTDLCERIVTGKRLVEEYEYRCEGG